MNAPWGDPNNSATKIYTGQDAIERLADFGHGLTARVIVRAVQEAIGYAAMVTEHHPRGSFGTQLYEWFTANFRNELVPTYWTVDRPDNLETTVHPEKVMAIAYSRGTSATGDPTRTPATASDKGRATATVVECNQLSFAIAGFEEPVAEGKVPTYFLLVWVDEASLEFRCELSLPSGMSSDNHVTRWLERIIIPLDGLLDGVRIIADDPDLVGGDDVVVEVERRAS